MTSTAKNFVGQNLRGRSFKRQDLSGADFTDADLSGADFTDAILRGANFSKVETGVQNRWLAFQFVISFFLSALSGLFTAYTGVVTTLFPAPYNIEIIRIVPSMAMIIIFCAAIIRQGFTARALVMIAGALALVTFVFALLGTVALPILFGGVVVALALVILSWTFALSRAVAFVGALAGSCNGALASLFVGWFGAGSFSSALAGSVTLASGTVLLSVYTAWRALKGDPKFDELLKLIVGFASIGGTSFRGADLTKANFTKAYLKSSDFRNSRKQSTNLTRIIWNQAKELERSRLGTSILANPEVRELLVTGKPNPSKSYEGLNLSGANLDGAYLEKVNFKRAILNEASFRNANLESGNFTESQAIGTDFTGAQMTDACLEGWSYDHTTKLDDVSLFSS
jgi:uncharacterized protein YjbI with pentapeptide repeats